MSRTLFDRLIRLLLLFTRLYLRHAPGCFGKAFVFERIYKPYLGWRHMSLQARTLFGARVSVQLPDLIQSRIYLFGQWEPAITRFVQATLKPGDTFIDVGANIGYYSLLAAHCVGSTGRIYAIEASPDIAATMRANIARNRCTQVDLIEAAASDHCHEIALYSGGSVNLGATTTHAGWASRMGFAMEARVSARPLADMIPREALLGARLIKIDVEGAEAAVIGGIATLLGQFSIHTQWIMELSPNMSDTHRDSVHGIWQQFHAAGYHAYHLINNYRIAEYTDRVPAPGPLVRLEAAPDAMVDVVFSRTVPWVA